jgi:hypothetical protein
MATARGVQVPEHVLVRKVDRELVLLNLDDEQYYGLDETGTAMWEAVTTAPTVDAAIRELLEQFEVDAETLTSDLETLLEELNSRGLVQFVPK